MLLLPWLDTSRVRSGRYRPMFKVWFWLLVVDFVVLMWCGSQPAEQPFVIISQLGTLYWFAFFLVIMPLLGVIEKPLPQPESIEADFRDALWHRRGSDGARRRQQPRRRMTAARSRGMMKTTILALTAALVLGSVAPLFAQEHDGGEGESPEDTHAAAHVTDFAFSFEGPFGRFDQSQLQRGLQVYTEVCARLPRAAVPVLPRARRARRRCR